MVTKKNRILSLCIPLVFVMACGQGSLQQPDLIAGRFANTTSLTVVDYYSTKAADFKTLLTDLPIVDSTLAGPWSFFLGFSQFLKGDLIEIVNKNPKNGQVKDFTAKSGSIEVWTCSAKCDDLKTNFSQVLNTDFSLSYRPDGGYVPKSDTPVSDFPPPAIALTFPVLLKLGLTVAIHVIADKVANTEGTFMKQVSDADGNKISTPGGSPVAGTILFQTK